MSDLPTSKERSIELPSWEEATAHVKGGTANALEKFIHHQEPAVFCGEDEFRAQLLDVLKQERGFWESEACQCIKCSASEPKPVASNAQLIALLEDELRAPYVVAMKPFALINLERCREIIDALRAAVEPCPAPTAWMVQYVEGGFKQSRVYVTEDDAKRYATAIERYRFVTSEIEISPLWSRPAPPPGVDNARLAWIGGGTLFDELCGVDIHEKAMSFADMAGREEPNENDLANAARYVIDAAIAEDSSLTKEGAL